MTEEPEDPESTWQEGDIRYNGKIYRYNKDILTFLAMGIDDRDKVSASTDYTKGGQSDAMFLAVANPHNKQISVIAINRDTMTEIDVYDKDNNFLSTVTAQLTLQHGYGDGKELSCERTVNAVSKLFYELPIHGYCSVNMSAVPMINDFVGGVDVELLEKIPVPYGSDILRGEIGQPVHLVGQDAFGYLIYRDNDAFNSAGQRLIRQKQYLKAFAYAAKEKTKADITFPIKLYDKVSDYTVTSVNASEISYLAPEMLTYSFSNDNVYSLKGETKMGEKFEEFYPDEEALYDLIIKVFYEPVE